MKKKKGITLLFIVMLILIIAILSVPVVVMINQNSNTTYDKLLTNKAEEIAYGGFLAMQEYIIANKTNFTNDIKNAPNNTIIYEFDMEYTPNGDTKNIIATTKNPIFSGSALKSVDVLTTVSYGEEFGKFENKINFSTTEIPGHILFPEEPNYIITKGLIGDLPKYSLNNDNVHRDGLYNRLYNYGVFEEDVTYIDPNRTSSATVTSTTYNKFKNMIPQIASDEHIQWFKDNSNFLEVNYNANVSLHNYFISSNIDKLEEQLQNIPKEERNPLNVLFINFTSEYNEVTITGTEKLDSTNQYYELNKTYEVNIDLSSLGNGIDETDFIVVTNGEIIVKTPNVRRDISKFNVTGGNVYFLSKGLLTFGSSNSGSMSMIHDIGTIHEDVAPQVTFASTKGKPFHNMFFYHGKLQNTFFYFPNTSKVGPIYNNIPSLDYGKQEISGGMTLGHSYNDYSYSNPHDYEGSGYNRSYFTQVNWRGKLEYFGYLID